MTVVGQHTYNKKKEVERLGGSTIELWQQQNFKYAQFNVHTYIYLSNNSTLPGCTHSKLQNPPTCRHSGALRAELVNGPRKRNGWINASDTLLRGCIDFSKVGRGGSGVSVIFNAKKGGPASELENVRENNDELSKSKVRYSYHTTVDVTSLPPYLIIDRWAHSAFQGYVPYIWAR